LAIQFDIRLTFGQSVFDEVNSLQNDPASLEQFGNRCWWILRLSI